MLKAAAVGECGLTNRWWEAAAAGQVAALRELLRGGYAVETRDATTKYKEKLLRPQPRVPPPGPRSHRAGRRVPGPVHVAQPPAPVAAPLDAQGPAPARRQL